MKGLERRLERLERDRAAPVVVWRETAEMALSLAGVSVGTQVVVVGWMDTDAAA